MDFLLEIGTEEIPARFIEPTLNQLKELSEKMLAENRISFDRLKTWGTPRRLVLYVWGIGEQQAEAFEEVKGPPKKAAFNEKGDPTKAAAGFARSQGVEVKDLVVKETPAGEYVFARKRYQGKPTKDVLAAELPVFITGLSFPKPMRWADRDLKFVRPIHWLLALLGEETIDFELDGLKPEKATYGLRFFAPGPFVVNRPEEYLNILRQGFVIVDQEERKKIVWNTAQKTAAAAGGQLRPHPELLEEITHLLEYPQPVCGSFSKSYLQLPPEVVITPMQEHQRYFPVWDQEGNLLPRFITFCNGPISDLELIREGNEKVLRARLEDAQFFYQDDLKVPLDEKVEKLREIVFLEGLGSIYDKAQRLAGLSRYLGSALDFPAKYREIAARAAFLAKADLVTNMVYEFPELQGIMGCAYARAAGETEEVCLAIKEHYQPRFAGDQLPETWPGVVVALAEKIDNLVGCFGLGLEPTGSQDPYALRRQALGIAHICLNKGIVFSLKDLIAQAFAAYEKDVLKESLESLQESILEFMRARLRNLFLDKGYSFDLVEAALGPGCDCPVLVQKRLEALSDYRKLPEFAALLTVYTRAANLARKATGTKLNPELFQEEAEQKLYYFWLEVKKEIVGFVDEGLYQQALVRSAALVKPVDRFFTEVMVMVEDAGLRQNRLALLKDIASTLEMLGDLNKIVKV